MSSTHMYYMRDPRLRPQDAEFTTLASKDLKRAFKASRRRVRHTRFQKSSLKNFLSHELQTRVLYGKPAFKASKYRVHYAWVWRTRDSGIYQLAFHQLTWRLRLQSIDAWIVNYLNFKKEVSKVSGRDQDTVSLRSMMTEPQENKVLLWQRLFPTWRRVL